MSRRGSPEGSTAALRDPPGGVAELVSTLAHELKTPLAVITGYAELLRARDDEATRRAAPAQIQEAAARLSSVIDDVLTVAAIDSGTFALDPAPIELREVVEDAIEAGSFAAVCAGEARLIVSADPESLARILTNLLTQAGERSPDGGEIPVNVERQGRFALVSVPAQELGPAPERAQLRLYAASRLVELHGGSFRAGGSTFSFTLPLAAPEELGSAPAGS